MLFWKPKPKKKAEKLTVKRQIAPSAIEPPKDIPHITIPKPEKSAAKGSTVTRTEKPAIIRKNFLRLSSRSPLPDTVLLRFGMILS